MENGTSTAPKKWSFKGNEALTKASATSIRTVLMNIMGKIDPRDPRPTIPLGHGDPSAFPCFRTTPVAEDAIADAVRSAKFNGYALQQVGIPPARRYLYIYT